jgi:hypothetical protein
MVVTRTEQTGKGEEREKGAYRLIIATVPKLSPPGRMGVLLENGRSQHDNGKDRYEWRYEPPLVKQVWEGGGSDSRKLRVVDAPGPKRSLAGELRVDPRGKTTKMFAIGLSSMPDVELLALLWPELPDRPLATGQKWRMRRAISARWVRDEVTLDVEVASLDGAVAVLGFAGQSKDGRLSVRGKARVSAAPPELLGVELDLVERTRGDDGSPRVATVRVEITLSPLPGARFADVLQPLIGP